MHKACTRPHYGSPSVLFSHSAIDIVRKCLSMMTCSVREVRDYVIHFRLCSGSVLLVQVCSVNECTCATLCLVLTLLH